MVCHTENLSFNFSPGTGTRALSLGMSSSAGTLDFEMPYFSLPPQAPGLLVGEPEEPSCSWQAGFVQK